jgi:putative NADPH-quinone reductase
VAHVDFPLLRRQKDWGPDAPTQAIKDAQSKIAASDHLVFFYPLWLGAMPALLKGFLEQTLRPGFAITAVEGSTRWKKLLVGKSARIVVTMGMPALIYRWYFGAHSLKSFERNILCFCGISPIKESLVGMVATESPRRRYKWLAKMQELGRKAQ